MPGSVRPDRETADLVCGRFTSSQHREAIGERFEVAVPETYQHRFNLAPQQRALIVHEADGGREAVMAKWGLLPHWAKDTTMTAYPTSTRVNSPRNDDSGLLLPEDVLAALVRADMHLVVAWNLGAA